MQEMGVKIGYPIGRIAAMVGVPLPMPDQIASFDDFAKYLESIADVLAVQLSVLHAMDDTQPLEPREQFWLAVWNEVDHAYAKHGREPWGRHEFYAIMLEEVDEVWDEIKADTPTRDVLKEVVQVAAMCLRYAETGDRYRGAHPLIPVRGVNPSPGS